MYSQFVLPGATDGKVASIPSTSELSVVSMSGGSGLTVYQLPLGLVTSRVAGGCGGDSVHALKLRMLGTHSSTDCSAPMNLQLLDQ